MAQPVPEPALSASSKKFLNALTSTNSQSAVSEQLSEFYSFENDLRRKFAQRESVPDLYQNLIPVFHSKVYSMGANKTKARKYDEKTSDQKYIAPLSEEKRRKDGEDSFVHSGIAGFKKNWSTFTEGALDELNWDNVFVAGGAVLACLQPLPKGIMTAGNHGPTPRAIRDYFHKQAYLASDIDLFLYGLENEEAAKAKMLEIYESIKAAARADVMCVRSSHAVTIVCEWPQRHIQIILRLYSSPSEILAGFDVDACAVGFNGTHVFAAPRAFVSLVTQSVTVDMSRRSPSYEMRLAKYSQRGFEIHVPDLRREDIDPTIFDRSPVRLQGLARLLVLSVLKNDDTRTKFIEQRRTKRARPPHPLASTYRNMRRRNFHRRDLKAAEMDGIFENNYDSIHIPYGQKFNAKKIERLMFQRDMVLNAEWNPKNLPPQRPYKLHRHPCFFGDMNDIFADCCGYCPEPDCAEAIALQKEEDERFVRGEVKFLIDDPGRQSVGSFHPITDSDWSEMAYLTQEALFAAAVAQNDSIKAKKMLEGYEQDEQQVVNKRDQTGRTMLFLAGLCSSNDVAQILVDAGARLTARNYDGRTILHLACQMGNTELLQMILKKSKANEEEKNQRGDTADTTDAENSSDSDGGFEKIKRSEAKEELDEFAELEDDDILDVNLPDWDCCLNPLHYAILQGHVSVVKILLANGADPTLAVKIPRAPPGFSTYSGVGKQTIFPIVLCAYPDNGIEIARLIFSPGISSRSDFNSSTALHALASLKRVDIVKFLLEQDPNAKGALNHLNTLSPPHWPLHWALVNCDIEMSRLLLRNGAHVTISEDEFVKRAEASNQWWFRNKRDNQKVLAIHYGSDVLQPLEVAVEYGNLDLVRLLVQYGAKVTSAPRKSYEGLEWREGQQLSYIELFEDIIELLENFLKRPTRNASLPEKPDDQGSFLTWISHQWKSQTASLPYLDDNVDGSPNLLTDSTRTQEELQLMEAKKAAIEVELAKYKELQSIFANKGAGSWNDIPENTLLQRSGRPRSFPVPAVTSKFDKSDIKFKVSYRTTIQNSQYDSYLELYEMVWSNDVKGIKERTLTRWGPNQDKEPLKVSVSETFDLARMLLQIARAQFRPKDENVNYYVARTYDSDYEREEEEIEDPEDTDYYIATERVDNSYELGDVTHIPDEAHSDISPVALLKQSIKFERLLALEDRAREGQSDPLPTEGPALTLTVILDDFDTFVKILDLVHEFDPDGLEDYVLELWEGAHQDGFKSSIPISMSLRLGRTRFIEELIRRAAFIFNWDAIEAELDMVHEESPVKVDPPKYYAGLRVRGKFRRDWAKAADPNSYTRYGVGRAASQPVTSWVAFNGDPGLIEWFFGPGPMKAVEKYIESHKSDKHTTMLEKINWKIRFSEIIGTKFNPNGDNVFHAALLSGKLPAILKTFQILTTQGIAPLTILQSKQRFPKHDSLLISARTSSHFQAVYGLYTSHGGDPTTTDDSGFNALHIFVLRKNVDDLKFCLNQLSEEQRAKMLSARSFRTLCTPLAFAVKSDRVDIVSLLLEYGKNQLHVRDGDGNLPIHSAIFHERAKITEILTKTDATVLLVEDASGSLPVEAALQRHLVSGFQIPPAAIGDRDRGSTRLAVWVDRIDERPAKEFVEKNDLKDVPNSQKTHEIVRKAMAGIDIRKRKLVSLLEVTDVIRRATRLLEPAVKASTEDSWPRVYNGFQFPNSFLEEKDWRK